MLSLKRLTGSTALALLLASGLAGPVRSQPHQSPAGEAKQQNQPEAAQQVSESDLKKLASAIERLQGVQQQSRQKVASAIQASGLSKQRFRTILQSQSGQGKSDKSDSVSAKEKKQFQQALDRIRDIQQESQKEKQQSIEEAGLTQTRFERLIKAVRQDKQLQQKVRKRLGS